MDDAYDITNDVAVLRKKFRDETGFMFPIAVIGFVTNILLCGFAIDIQQTILAIKYPLMFTISTMMGK